MNTSEPKPTENATKKPYDKPEVIYKQSLEAMAAACTPIGPGAGKADTGSPSFCGVLFS